MAGKPEHMTDSDVAVCAMKAKRFADAYQANEDARKALANPPAELDSTGRVQWQQHQQAQLSQTERPLAYALEQFLLLCDDICRRAHKI
jgi:hypothetical protein